MTATPPLVTPEDLLQLPDEGKSYELVDGHLKELAASKESSRIGTKFIAALDSFVEQEQLGWVYPMDCGFRCFPDDPNRIRKPDVAFVSFERMPSETYTDEGFCTAVPDLVVEVVSTRDLATELDDKIEEFFAAGVRTVWVAYPNSRSIHAFRADGTSEILRETDTLTEPKILPGFTFPVAKFFRRPKPRVADSRGERPKTN